MYTVSKQNVRAMLAMMVISFSIPAFADPESQSSNQNLANPTDQRALKKEMKQARKAEKFLDHITQQLNLTPEQQEKIKAMSGGESEQMSRKHEVMRTAHDELEQAMKSSASDEEIRAKFTELEKIQSEFAKARLERVLAIRAVLTPEQRTKFKGMGHGEFKRRGRKH